MPLNKKFPFFIKTLLALAPFLVLFGCAVQQKPQGGPKDVTPPKLLKATPANQTRNFTAKQIRLDFDEYFKLNNQFQEITVFPDTGKLPDFKIHQRSLVITLKDQLQKNTTYVINFGKAIADVNEGNVLKNFTYVFSTGPHIDSLSISGNVINVLTQKSEKPAPGSNNSDVTVMLFTLKQDSLLFGKKKPSIYTTADTSGNFTISNLKEGVYKIYAIKEPTGPNKVYDNDNELIAFAKNPIHLSHDTTGINLQLFRAIPPKIRFTTRKFDNDGKMLFAFNKPLENPSVKIVYPAELDQQKIVDINKTKDTILVYSKNMNFDSVRLVFSDNKKPIDTAYLLKGKKESFSHSAVVNFGLSQSGTVLKPNTDLNLYLTEPIEDFEKSQITLKEDSTLVNYVITKDTANAKHFILKYNWKAKKSYNITTDEGAFTTIYGDKNKKQFKIFKLDNPQSYCNLILKMNVPDASKSYVVELVNDQGIVVRSDVITSNTTLTYKNLYIAKFTLRVAYDDNHNGKWDSGSLQEKRQPENIWVSDKTFTLRAGWDVNETIDIPSEKRTTP